MPLSGREGGTVRLLRRDDGDGKAEVPTRAGRSMCSQWETRAGSVETMISS